MLRVYKKIDHKIFKAQELVSALVIDIFCKADRRRCLTLINTYPILKKLYENPRSDWFKNEVESIYIKCRKLTDKERKILEAVFLKNNEIEYLCVNPSKRKALSQLSSKISNEITNFFKEFYDRFLEWKDISDEYGTKKDYYDDLIWENDFKSICPCCGYGIIKTVYDKGHSAFDHYLPLKHYPFSVVNFNNLFPLCTDCNSSSKGEKDVLERNKKIFYPFSLNHPKIGFEIKVSPKNLIKFVTKTERIRDNELSIKAVYDKKYDEEVKSWNFIFETNQRHFGQVATNSVSWIDDVREKYRKGGKTFSECFDAIIEDDSNKYLGFLKAPFLKELKKYDSFVKAFEESSGSHMINPAKPIT